MAFRFDHDGADMTTPTPATPALPHGGALCIRYARDDEAKDLKRESAKLPAWDLTPRQQCDLELIMNGAFSPLRGFLVQRDHDRVVTEMRLADGTLWPIPVTLQVNEAFAAQAPRGSRIALLDLEGVPLAIMDIEDAWRPDLQQEAAHVFGTIDDHHPGVAQTLAAGPIALGGQVTGIQAPMHHSFRALRHDPASVRQMIADKAWSATVAFQTRNPMHRSHFELTRRAMEEARAGLLLQPVVGMTKPGDIDHYTRVRCYQAIIPHYAGDRAILSLLPLAMRMAGPREALWHAIIRKNFGATHFIVGRDHAGPGNDRSGRPYYQPYAAQELVKKHEAELGIHLMAFAEMRYVPDLGTYMTEAEVPPGARTDSISGTQLRSFLRRGAPIPAWFTFDEVAAELRRAHPPRSSQGFTVFFTGLSGAGKSTIARALQESLMERGDRPVTLLDGDIVRKYLSSELGFSKEHRDINIRRIGFVANEITKNRGIAVCAPIAPYDKTRRDVREMIEGSGGFVLVHVATPLETCEARDRKGLYAKARAGLITAFTGVSDPYEPPADAEIVVTTLDSTPEDDARRILAYLEAEGFLGGADNSRAPTTSARIAALAPMSTMTSNTVG